MLRCHRRLKTLVLPAAGDGIQLLLLHNGRSNCWSTTTKLAVKMLSTTTMEEKSSSPTGTASVKGSAARKLLPADEKHQQHPAGHELFSKLMEVQNQFEREQQQQKTDLDRINTNMLLTNRRLESRLAKLEASVQRRLTMGHQQQRSTEKEQNSVGKELTVWHKIVLLCLAGTLVHLLCSFLLIWMDGEEDEPKEERTLCLSARCKKAAVKWWYTKNETFITNDVDNSLNGNDEGKCNVELLILANNGVGKKSPNIGVVNVPGNKLDTAEGKCSAELLISADGVTVKNRAVDNNAISRIRTKRPFTMPPPSFLSSAKDGNADHIIFYYEVHVNKNNGDIALSFTGPGELINEPTESAGMPISDFFASLFLNIVLAGLVPIGGSTEPNKPKNNAQLMSNFAACTCTTPPKRGDVLGCGLVLTKEAAGQDGMARRLFFTRNGKICCEPVRLPSSTDKLKQLYPTISLSGRSTSVEVNLLGSIIDGPNGKKPFRYDLAKHPGLDLEK